MIQVLLTIELSPRNVFLCDPLRTAVICFRKVARRISPVSPFAPAQQLERRGLI